MQADTVRRPPRIFAAILFVIACAYLYGGIKLIAVGGSLYYVLAGVAIACVAALIWRRDRRPLASLWRIVARDVLLGAATRSGRFRGR